MHGPEGVSPKDGTNIPASFQTNTNQYQFHPTGWPFLLVVMVWMRAHVSGSKKSSGTIFNACFLCGPEGVPKYKRGRDGTNIPAVQQIQFVGIRSSPQPTDL